MTRAERLPPAGDLSYLAGSDILDRFTQHLGALGANP